MRFVPAAGNGGIADASLGRMCQRLEEAHCREMRIVDQGIEVVHRRAGNVATLEQRDPFGGGTAAQDVGDDAIHFIVMLRALGLVGQARIGGKFVEPADGLEKRPPMLVGIDERADIAVAGRIGAAVRGSTAARNRAYPAAVRMNARRADRPAPFAPSSRTSAVRPIGLRRCGREEAARRERRAPH